MDLRKASRDPWVWGQFALVGLVAVLTPLLPRYVSLGDADYALNRVDPTWIRALGGVVGGIGLAIGVWGVRSLGPSLTPGAEPPSHATAPPRPHPDPRAAPRTPAPTH